MTFLKNTFVARCLTLPFFVFEGELVRLPCMPSFASLILYWFYTNSILKSEREAAWNISALTTSKPKSWWNIPQQSLCPQVLSMARSVRKSKSLGKWILSLLAKETCLAKKRSPISEHSSNPAYYSNVRNDYAKELSITVSREWRSFVLNLCTIEMHNAYQFSGKQVFSVVSPCHDFPEKHICFKMLNTASSFFSLKENWSASVDTLRALDSLILCSNSLKYSAAH